MINNQAIGLQHALQCSFRYGLSNGTCTRGDDGLRADSECGYWDILCQAVGEDSLSETGEQGSSKQLTEDNDSPGQTQSVFASVDNECRRTYHAVYVRIPASRS